MGPAMRQLAWLLAGVLWLTSCGPREPVVKIGFAGPLTGDQAAHGLDLLRGAQLALEEAQRQGPILPGHRVELVAMDDQRSPTQAVSVAKKFVADPDVMAVIGHLNSSCTMPASAVYHTARLLELSPVSSNPQISRQGFETFYRICATDDVQGPAAAQFLMDQLQARRIFLIDDMTTYGRGLANEFARAVQEHRGQLLGHEGIPQGEKDFAPLLTKIKSLAPEAIYFAGMYPEGALLIKQRYELQVPAIFMGGDGLFEEALVQLATPQAAEGVYLTTLGGDIAGVPAAQGFVRAYEAKYGAVGAYSAYAYEAMNIVLWAIKTAGQKDRAAVLAAMKHLKEYSGILGVHTFNEQGDTRNRIIGIFTVRNGRFTFVTQVVK